MAHVKFGINVLGYSYTPDIIRRAEEKNFDLATIVEGQLLWRDVYSSLTVSATKTSRILGPGMTNPVTRHPSVTAGAIATLNELSKGRAVLGIGRGNNALATIGYHKASLQNLTEYVKAVKEYLSGETRVVYHDGVSTVPLWGKSSIPILVAAQGPKMLRAAGEIADGVVILGPPQPNALKWALQNIESGAKKRRDRIKPEVCLYTHSYVSSDMSKAREMCKGSVSAAYNIFAAEPSLKTDDLSPELSLNLSRIRNEMKYNFQQHLILGAEHAKTLTDEDVDLWSIIGVTDRVIDRFSKLNQLGIDTFLLSVPWDANDLTTFLDEFGNSVISYFK